MSPTRKVGPRPAHRGADRRAAAYRRRQQRRRQAVMVLGGLAALGLLIAAWLGAANLGGGDTPAGDGTNHLHGLGVDPDSGDLYAASHNGLFRMARPGSLRQVGPAHDLMGFTVAGPDRLLASGHAAAGDRLRRSGRPNRVGLVESRDGGRTWRSLSLLGEADFHALAYTHDRVYGYDEAGRRFMVSTDGREWETRSQQALVSVAVSPDNADTVMGVGGQGVVTSTDGGRTWQPNDPSTPPMALLSWDKEAGLWGVTFDGTVMKSPDGGGTWEEGGILPGEPAAFVATGQRLVAGLHPAGIVESTDGGQNWDEVADLAEE